MLSERQQAILKDEFEQSCETWYGFVQENSKKENLQNNYMGRQDISKKILQWSTYTAEESLEAYRQIKDELAKIEIAYCQKYHNCMPPLRDLYPVSDEVKKFIEEKGYGKT